MTAALALALASGPSTARGQAMDSYGFGSRGAAMAGAVSADVRDASANYYNPAGLALSDGLRLSLGWFYAHHQLSLNGLDSAVDPAHGLVTGLVAPGRIGDVRFAFGVGLHLPDQRVSRTRTLPRTQPRWELYDNRPQRIYLAAHVAIAPAEWISIGGGLSFLSQSDNRLEIRGVIDVLQPELESRLEHQLKGSLLALRYPQVGVQIHPLDELSFGVVYRGQQGINNRLFTEVNAILRLGGLPIPGRFFLVSESVNAFIPQQLSFAVSGTPVPWLRLSAELTWLDWSAYVSPIGTSEVLLEIDVPPELGDTIEVPEEIVGGSPIAADFRDRFVPRLGVEATAYDDPQVGVQVRGGYLYENTPAPVQTDVTNLVDTNRHTVSLGGGLTLRDLAPLIDGFVQIDLHLQLSLMERRRMVKVSPIDPIGDYVAQGFILAGGVTAELAFE